MRVGVITRGRNPWIYFVARELRARGVEVVILNEIARSRNLLGWRFLKRRGLVHFLDLSLFALRNKAAAKGNAVLRRLLPRRQVSPSTASPPFDESRPSSFAGVLTQLENELKHDDGLAREDFARINAKESVDAIKRLDLDRLMTCGAPLLRKRFLRSANPILNAHCGIAPEYRGSSPFHWAIYNRDFGRIGYTIHLVTSAVDGGKVLLKKTVRPGRSWTLTDLDWYLVRNMYLDLVEIICADDFPERLDRATEQVLDQDSWPPMGYVRTLTTRRRLRRWQEGP